MASAIVKPWAERHGIDLGVAYCLAETVRKWDDFSGVSYWDDWAAKKLDEQFPDTAKQEQICEELRQEFIARGIING